jgi:hypothetical protein
MPAARSLPHPEWSLPQLSGPFAVAVTTGAAATEFQSDHRRDACAARAQNKLHEVKGFTASANLADRE